MDLESDRVQNTSESVSQALQQRVTRRTCDFHVAPRACTSTFDIARQTIYLVNETRRARTSRLASLEESRKGGREGETRRERKLPDSRKARRRGGRRKKKEEDGWAENVRASAPGYSRPISPGSCPRNFSYSNSQPNN